MSANSIIRSMDKHQAIEQMRLESWPDGLVVICHGKPICEKQTDDCNDCWVIRADDKRSTRTIMNQMKRRH